jgi:hypothetical protein
MHEDFYVYSTPVGALVQTSNGMACQTPCTLGHVPRRGGFVVTVSQPGYKPKVTSIHSGPSIGGVVGFAGNGIIGSYVGAAVDIASGAMNDLSPNPLIVTLEPDTVAIASVSPAQSAQPAHVGAPAASPHP